MDGITAIFTEGGMGSGKSYFRGCRHVVDYLLPETNYRIVTNIPLDVEKVADWVHKKYSRLSRESIIGRIHIIPKSVQVGWESGSANPVAYLKQQGLENTYIIIDEAHHFWPDSGERERIHGFKTFISTLRHEGAQIELISQSADNVHSSVRRLIQVKYIVIPNEQLRMPYLGIKLGDLYELWAGFVTRQYDSGVRIEERIKQGRRWILEDTKFSYRDPLYFGLYDTHGGVVEESEDDEDLDEDKPTRQIYEFEKRTRLGLLWWFIKRNWVRPTLIGLAATAIFTFLALGGINKTIPVIMQHFTGIMAGKASAKLSTDTTEQPAEPEKSADSQTDATVYASDITILLTKIADLGAENDKYKTEISDYKQQLTRQKQVEELIKRQVAEYQKILEKASEIVLISGQTAVLQDGQKLNSGETILNGKYKNRVIEKIEQKTGKIILDDGVILSIGDRLQSFTEQTGG